MDRVQQIKARITQLNDKLAVLWNDYPTGTPIYDKPMREATAEIQRLEQELEQIDDDEA